MFAGFLDRKTAEGVHLHKLGRLGIGSGESMNEVPLGLECPDGKERFRRLADQWNDDAYATRERASEEILALGLSVTPELEKLAKTSKSPEIRIRARDALDRAFASAGMCPEGAPTA